MSDSSHRSSAGTRRAYALGAAAGLRSMTPPAVLAARGRWGRGPVSWLLPLAAAGEIAADKTPFIPSRSSAPPLVGRVLSGAAVGAAVGGARGAGAGAAGAAATTYAAERLRSAVVAHTGLADVAVAAVEDAVALGIATAASADGAGATTPSTPEAPDRAGTPSPLRAVLRGLLAAAAGTAAMTSVQMAYLKATGGSPSATPEEMGRRVAEGVLRQRVPRRRRGALNMATHLAYGTLWGVPLGLVAGSLPRTAPASLLGAATGIVVWGAGLAGLPAVDLAPPPWEQPAPALAVDLALHLVYGGATAAAYRAFGG